MAARRASCRTPSPTMVASETLIDRRTARWRSGASCQLLASPSEAFGLLRTSPVAADGFPIRIIRVEAQGLDEVARAAPTLSEKTATSADSRRDSSRPRNGATPRTSKNGSVTDALRTSRVAATANRACGDQRNRQLYDRTLVLVQSMMAEWPGILAKNRQSFMKLPNSERAWIPEQKLRDYLLSMTHSVGRSKARFFRKFGFHDENVDHLETGLLAIARFQVVVQATESSFGVKYVIDGELDTPSGRTVKVRTAWIIEAGEDAPRFVTAHPG